MKLTERQADDVAQAVRHAIYERAKGALGKDAYYKSTAKIEKEIGKDGAVTLLIVSGDIGGKREPRQVIFYRDDRDGTFYLEGDLRADPENQYAFEAGLAKLCEIWGVKLEDFYGALYPEIRQIVEAHKGEPIQQAIDEIDHDDWILSMKDSMDSADMDLSNAYMQAKRHLERLREEGRTTV